MRLEDKLFIGMVIICFVIFFGGFFIILHFVIKYW